MNLWLKFCFSLLFLSCTAEGAENCTDPDEISCRRADRCIPHRYICDTDNDCDDGDGGSDEDPDLCNAWLDPVCGKGETTCTRRGSSSCISISSYCRLDNPPCEGTLERRVCQMLEIGELVHLSEIDENVDIETNRNISELLADEYVHQLPKTIQHDDCPTFFTKIDNRCISVFSPGAVSWGVAREFCSQIGGELLSVSYPDFNILTEHLKKYGQGRDYWVGGHYFSEEGTWKWLDGTPMPLGTPFWALRHGVCELRDFYLESSNSTVKANDGTCYSYKQAPSDPPKGPCAALSYEHFYYMTDEDCIERKSPLCIVANKRK